MKYDVQEGTEMAWHGLTRVKEGLTLATCWLATAWDYIVKPVFVEGKKTPFCVLGVTDDCPVDIVNPETGAPTGETHPLIVGDMFNPDTFKPILNVKLNAALAKAIDGTGLVLESNGSIMNRGRTFYSFHMPDSAGEGHKGYLNIGNGNNQTSPLWVNTSVTKTVCNNTFTLNMGSAGCIMEVKKTKFSELKIENFGRAIDAMLKGQKEYAKQLGILGNAACDETTAREFFAGFLCDDPTIPMSTRAANTVDTLIALYKTGAGNKGVSFNDVFQALTDYYTHSAANSGDDAAARWKNFVSSEFGAGNKAKQKAWNIVIDAKLRKSVVNIGKGVLRTTAKAARNAERVDNDNDNAS